MYWGFNFGNVVKRPTYDCHESETLLGPGTSACSPEQLCSKNLLFSPPIFLTGFGDFAPVLHLLFFILPTIGYFIPAMYSLQHIIRIHISGQRWTMEDIFHYWKELETVSITGNFMIAVLSLTPSTYLLLERIEIDLIVGYRESTVTGDLECRAVHVALSAWRDYLDVNTYGRAFRVVKLWFNA